MKKDYTKLEKELTKNQSDVIFNWLFLKTNMQIAEQFQNTFPPACCDSCADGHTCESEEEE